MLLRKEPVRTEQPISTRHRHLAERKHTQYDAGLGWVNIPNLAISNLYGSGKHLHINNLGFRGRHPVADEVASEARRIILSGDSFTFGYGVGDEDTWGAGLARRFGHVEVLNMGLGGYGVDQAYLRYLRDGVTLDHDLHLFSFITEDFKRMTRPRFMGYGKPVVTVREGRLVTEHVPVPPTVRDGLTRWQTAVQKLHLVRYVNVKLGQFAGKRLAFWAGAATDTARHIFLDLPKAPYYGPWPWFTSRWARIITTRNPIAGGPGCANTRSDISGSLLIWWRSWPGCRRTRLPVSLFAGRH